jgi:agmatine deiminase
MPIAELIDYVLKPEDPAYALFKSFIDANGGVFWDGTPWPDGDVHFFAATSYCNFFICNDVVLGQKYYKDGMDPIIKQKDEKAEALLQECFPERKVIMIDTIALNVFAGGIHCWTKEAAAAQ